MTARGVEIAIDRLVLDGFDMAPEQSEMLVRLVEAEVRRIVDGGRLTATRTMSAAQIQPLALSDPPDLPALARALAERITDEAADGVVGHA
jgi:hypothetical protein